MVYGHATMRKMISCILVIERSLPCEEVLESEEYSETDAEEYHQWEGDREQKHFD